MSALKICLVSSEFTPFAKTGGLADVSGALTRHLHDQGHDVRTLIPGYGRIEDAGFEFHPVDWAARHDTAGRKQNFSVLYFADYRTRQRHAAVFTAMSRTLWKKQHLHQR